MCLPTAEQLAALRSAPNWEARMRILTRLRLPDYPPQWRDAAHLVQGCDTPVWLAHDWQAGCLYLQAASDSRIVGGLLAVLLAQLNGQTAHVISQFALEPYFSDLGLASHLSSSRRDGLRAIVTQIQRLAAEASVGAAPQ